MLNVAFSELKMKKGKVVLTNRGSISTMQSVTGTLISYYFICKTKLWLHARRLNLEDNSEDVRIGRVLHELNEEKSKQAEIKIDNVKLDKITKEYLTELKKSDSDPQAVKWQVLLYLYKLKQKGIIRKGKIEYAEKNRNEKPEILELDDANEKELLEVLERIEGLLSTPTPPPATLEPKCKKCAYYEYCFI